MPRLFIFEEFTVNNNANKTVITSSITKGADRQGGQQSIK